jgi:hypothetical protein
MKTPIFFETTSERRAYHALASNESLRHWCSVFGIDYATTPSPSAWFLVVQAYLSRPLRLTGLIG